MEAFSSPYIDDIIVYSSDWSCHMFHIAQVLSRLQSHGLTIKISKCLWGCRQFEFLGLIVGNGKLSIPESRVDKFKSFVMPKTKKQLQSFLGMCNYYRKFIPSFADITHSLYPQTSTKSPTLLTWNTTLTLCLYLLIVSKCSVMCGWSALCL